MRHALLLVAAVSLVGCAEMQRINAKAEARNREEDRSTCASYGYTPGTDAFADCMMMAAHRREKQQREMQRQVEADARGDGGGATENGGGDSGDTHCKTTTTTTQSGDSETTKSNTVCHN